MRWECSCWPASHWACAKSLPRAKVEGCTDTSNLLFGHSEDQSEGRDCLLLSLVFLGWQCVAMTLASLRSFRKEDLQGQNATSVLTRQEDNEHCNCSFQTNCNPGLSSRCGTDLGYLINLLSYNCFLGLNIAAIIDTEQISSSHSLHIHRSGAGVVLGRPHNIIGSRSEQPLNILMPVQESLCLLCCHGPMQESLVQVNHLDAFHNLAWSGA